jgi:hypothetical protein
MNIRFLPHSAGRALGTAAAFAFIHAVSPGQSITGTAPLIPQFGDSPLNSNPIITDISFASSLPLNTPGLQITGVEFTFTPGAVIVGGEDNNTNLGNSIALALTLPIPAETSPVTPQPPSVPFDNTDPFAGSPGGVPQTAGQPNIAPIQLGAGSLDTGVALSGFVGSGAPTLELSSNFGVTKAESDAIIAYLNAASGGPIGIGLVDYNAANTNNIDITWGVGALPDQATGGLQDATVTFLFEVPFSPVQWLGIGAVLLMAAAKIGWRRMPGMVGLC